LNNRSIDGGVVMAFRGAAKSTLAEENIILDACFKSFHNCVIVAASEKRALERLAAIKREFETNETLRDLMGDQVGHPWQETKIVLKSGICIQAIGRDQAVRGLKHLDWRPDRILIDDVEEPESVQTEEGRRKTMAWFVSELLPAADVSCPIRILATPMDKESVPQRLIDDAGWPSLVIPIEYKDQDTGERRASWPGLMPLKVIDQKMEVYRNLGLMHRWAAEYLCQATSAADRVFGPLPVIARQRSWEAVYVMIDPARTTNRLTSATTGIAVWSWIGTRLVVWRARAEYWKPDEIIKHLFWLDAEFEPVWIGFEEDGLNEWALQPIRQEQIRRGKVIPLRPIRAPKNKLEFIKGLHPYAAAGDIVLAEDCPDLVSQLMSFPAGRIDVPNALAYAPRMRAGAPVYDNFSENNIDERMEAANDTPVYLAANSDGKIVTAILVQRRQGEIHVLADWIREGSPQEVVADVHAEAALASAGTSFGERIIYGEGEEIFKLPIHVPYTAQTPIRWIVPRWHTETYRNVGLMQAVRMIPQPVSAGTESDGGRTALATMLSQLHHGRPKISISIFAKWTLRAFAGGYARALGSRGLVDFEAETGIYRVLMEGLESFVGVGAMADRNSDADNSQPIAYDKAGHAYRSALPQRMH